MQVTTGENAAIDDCDIHMIRWGRQKRGYDRGAAVSLRRAMLACACACGPQVGTDDGAADTTGGSASASTSASASATDPSATDPTATDPSGDPTSATAPGTSVTTAGEVETGVDDDTSGSDCPADLGVTRWCDPWTEDCPCGFKCMPWASGGYWDSLKCSPLAKDPNGIGEPCTVEGSVFTGIDDCDIHSMCWNVDPETNMGTCVAFCTGEPGDPGCAGECENCIIAHDGVLNLCLATCDPLGSDCDDDEICGRWETRFVCLMAGQDLLLGEPCEYEDSCAHGLFCAPAANVPGCTGDGCCTPYCDAEIFDSCASAAEGTACIPWNGSLATCDSPTLGVCLVDA